jgi:hypothetical protein
MKPFDLSRASCLFSLPFSKTFHKSHFIFQDFSRTLFLLGTIVLSQCDNGNYMVLKDRCLLCASCRYGSTGHAMLPHMCGRVLDMPCSPTCVAIGSEKNDSLNHWSGQTPASHQSQFLVVPCSFPLFHPLGEVRPPCTILPQIVPPSVKMEYH